MFKVMIFIFLFSISLEAKIPVDTIKLMYVDLSVQERHDYKFVTQSCHLDLNSFANLVESTKDDTIDYFHYFLGINNSLIPEPENILTRRGIGKHTHRLLNSLGYYVGLMACFPESERKRNIYTINLLLFDAYGKATAISMIGVSGAVIYRGLAFVGSRAVVAPTVSVFKRLNASEKILANIPKYLGRAGIITFNGLSLVVIADHIYRIRQEREVVAQIYSQDDLNSIRRNFETNLDLYYQTLALREHAKTSEDKIRIEKLILEQKNTTSFYLDQMLKEEAINPKEKEKLLAVKQFVDHES